MSQQDKDGSTAAGERQGKGTKGTENVDEAGYIISSLVCVYIYILATWAAQSTIEKYKTQKQFS